MKSFFPIILSLVVINNISAQLSVSNIYEFQLGNIPRFEPDDLSTHYDQLNAFYVYKNFSAKLRLENFLSPDHSKNYTKLSQYNIAFQDDNFGIKIGHFNDIIGKGLLLRAYEIPGSVFEDQAYRIRYGFYRDLRGFSAQFSNKRFSFKALRGEVLLNLYPPTFPDSSRYIDLVEGLESVVKIGKHKFGKGFLRNRSMDSTSSYGNVYLTGELPGNFSYYVEYARILDKNILSNVIFWDADAYAYYASINFVYKQLGISLEYKNYKRFFIGSGITDPPTLVKEHSYKLLNRSTHVPDLNSESGYQAEIYYQFSNGAALTLNNVMAVNKYQQTYRFNEYFAELVYPVNLSVIKLFTDYARDPFTFEKNRYTYGLSWEQMLKRLWSFTVEFEHQWFKREQLSEPNSDNAFVKFQVAKSPKFAAGIIWEFSTDPQVTDNIETFEIEKGIRHWTGATFTYNYKSHMLTMFAGERRGGPACTSGICYNVLDFKGIELRLTSRF